MKLRELSPNELNEFLDQAQSELLRRKNVQSALSEVKVILQNYNVSWKDLAEGLEEKTSKSILPKQESTKGLRKVKRSDISKKKPSGKPKAFKKTDAGLTSKATDKRTLVFPKYVNPSTGLKWSGRGRPPKWVKVLCATRKLSMEQFKSNPEFQIANHNQK